MTSGLQSLAKSPGPAASSPAPLRAAPESGLGEALGLTRRPEAGRPGPLPELRALPGAGKRRDDRPALTPRSPRAWAPRPVGSCRRQLRDGGRRGSGARRRGPPCPGRPHGPGAGPREGPGRAPPPAPRRVGSRRRRRRRSEALARFHFLYRSERGFQEEAGLGGQGVFVRSLAAAAANGRSPPGAHGSPAAAPPGPGLAAGGGGWWAPGAGGAFSRWGCGPGGSRSAGRET